MEEKPDSSQQTAINETADKILANVKKFNMLSLVGLGLVVVFFVFMFIDGFNYRWLIMLPISGAAAFILYRQDSETQGFEKKICYYGLIVLAALFVMRDISMASKHLDRLKTGATSNENYKALNTKLDAVIENLKNRKGK